jgi:tetratricopeptide (TPR) repeat protein
LIQSAPIETIPSWEHTENTPQNSQRTSIVNSADYDALLKQFVALGYMPANSGNDDDDAQNATLENQWNLARVYLDSGRLLQALPLLEEVYEQWPLRLEIPWLLADCQFRIGLKAEAAEVIQNLIAIFPDRPMAQLCRAVLEYEQGNIENALVYLKALELRRPAEPSFYNRLGFSCLRLNRIEEARRAFARTREIEPDNAMSFIGESRCLMRLGKNEEAAQNALLALGVNFSLVAGHYYLGMALARLGDLDRSLQAFETCLRFNPGHVAALRCLIRICVALCDSEKEKVYRELYDKNSKARLNPELRLAEFRRQAQVRAADRKERRSATNRILREELRRISQNNSSISQTPKTFVIVSGLPRSGTSLMMQVLQAGGIPPMTDQRRKSDIDNPEGYFEWEAIKEIVRKPDLIEQADGKVVKVISMLLPHLPRGHRYKIIFMDRPIEEIAASQSLMLQRSRQEFAAPKEMTFLLQQHRDDILQTLERAPDVEFCVVNYPALIENPKPQLQRIVEFLGDRLATPEKMQDVIRPELYRNRAELTRVGK